MATFLWLFGLTVVGLWSYLFYREATHRIDEDELYLLVFPVGGTVIWLVLWLLYLIFS